MGAVDFVNVSVLAAFFATVVFLTGYSVLAPWWRNPVGRAVASLDAALLLALLPSVLRLVFGLHFVRDSWYAWYYGVSLLLVAAVTLWRLLVIWTVQRDALAPRRRD